MAYKLLLPKFGMAMEAAKILEWKKEVGEYINVEEAVLAVENEKLTNDIISMEAGFLIRKVAQIGETYQVGDLLAWLGKEGETVEEAPAEPAAPAEKAAPEVTETAAETPARAAKAEAPAGQSGRASASPLAKKLAAQLGLDYTQIPGTGPGGRIDKEDVLKYAESLKAAAAAAPAPAAQTPAAPPPEAPVIQPAQSVQPAQGDGYVLVPYAGMRKAVGDRMLQAWTGVPMVTHHVQANAGALQEIRRQLNEGVEDKSQRFSVNDLLLKITAAVLMKKPALNATFESDGIHVHHSVNLGMATAVDNGLIVPVIHGAEGKSLAEISREAKRLAAAARSGRLVADDVVGGTFTISNLGGYDSVDFFTPIVNPPQAAILGVGRISDAAVPVGGEIRALPMISLSLTYDHRVLDGAVAAEFMKIFIALLENPLQTLLNI